MTGDTFRFYQSPNVSSLMILADNAADFVSWGEHSDVCRLPALVSHRVGLVFEGIRPQGVAYVQSRGAYKTHVRF